MKKHKEIQRLAYEMFEKSGGFHGRELDHWLEAERIIRAREIEVRAADIEAISKQRIVERSDTRRHEAKKIGKTKK